MKNINVNNEVCVAPNSEQGAEMFCRLSTQIGVTRKIFAEHEPRASSGLHGKRITSAGSSSSSWKIRVRYHSSTLTPAGPNTRQTRARPSVQDEFMQTQEKQDVYEKNI